MNINRLKLARYLAVALVAFGGLAAGCSAGVDGNGGEDTEGATISGSQALVGGDTQFSTTQDVMPMAATGNLSITKPGLGNFGCSASLIRRDVLVTSGHCFCSANFSPPIITNATVSFTYRDIAGTLNTVNARGYAVNPSYTCDGSTSFDHADDDVAVVSLANAVPPAKLPQVLSVYTSGNLMDRIFNSVQETPSFWNGPLQITGYSSSGAGPFSRQTGTIPHLRYENDCGLLNLASCSGYVTWGAWSDNVPQVQPGDSGGPWTFKQYDRDYTVFAVSHGGKRPAVGFEKTLGAPTFDNGRGNGTFVNGFISDADDDGVTDATDNCQPSRCRFPIDCKNPDQADADGDGIGDACDNCPASLCTSKGWPMGACQNGDQTDSDNDGVGDACDMCPTKRTDRKEGDADQDLVGDSCDNCGSQNGYAACKTNADCPNTRCLTRQLSFGRCSTTGAACFGVAECPGGSCLGAGTFGRCERQMDDPDGDGIGASCDSCPTVAEARVQANSNTVAEEREKQPALGDVCDPVPTLVSRTVQGVLRVDGTPGPDESLGSSEHDTTFTTTAGIGAGGVSSTFSGRAGFRFCSCVSTATGEVLGDDECAKTQCRAVPWAYSVPGTQWKAITVAASGQLARPTGPAPAPGTEIDRTFTNDVTCRDILAHPGYPETCRVGRQLELVTWMHEQDIVAGRVLGARGATNKTSGFMLGYVRTEGGSFASGRDQETGGRLRESYESVSVPSITIAPPGPSFGSVRDKCLGAGCFLRWRKDWLWLVDDWSRRVNPSPLDAVSNLSRIRQIDGRIFAETSGRQASFDITDALSPSVREIMKVPNMRWISPVEAGMKGRNASSVLLMAALPVDWKQSFVRPFGIALANGQLRSIAEVKRFSSAISTTGASAASGQAVKFVPSDRTGARTIFSAREQSLYLLGGRSADGVAAGEVWRYDFGSDTWTHLFMSLKTLQATALADVQALAYDDKAGRLLVLDRTTTKNPVPFLPPIQVGRLVLLDLRTDTSRVVVTLPVTGLFDRMGLVAEEDGTFVFVGNMSNGLGWQAHRFTVSADGAFRWIGVMAGPGATQDDPLRLPGRVVLPVVRNNVSEDVELAKGQFIPDVFRSLKGL